MTKVNITPPKTIAEAIILQLIDPENDVLLFGEEDAADNSPEMKKRKSEFKVKLKELLVPMIDFVEATETPVDNYLAMRQLTRFLGFAIAFGMVRGVRREGMLRAIMELVGDFTDTIKGGHKVFSFIQSATEENKDRMIEELKKRGVKFDG